MRYLSNQHTTHCIMMMLVMSLLQVALLPNIVTAESANGCQAITAQESDDKNYYRVTATSDAKDITGYEFNFGDRESFTLHFDKSTKDRRQTTVKHTYRQNGLYTISAHALTAKNDPSQPTASCKTQVAIGTGAQLPSTGPEDTLVGLPILAGLLTYVVARSHQEQKFWNQGGLK